MKLFDNDVMVAAARKTVGSRGPPLSYTYGSSKLVVSLFGNN